MEKAFVAGTGLLAKVVGILKVHIYSTQPHHWSGSFRSKTQRNSFFGLDVQHQLVRHQVLDGRVAEKYEWRAPELDDDMRVARGHALASPEVERYIRPAPVVDLQLHRDESLGP